MPGKSQMICTLEYMMPALDIRMDLADPAQHIMISYTGSKPSRYVKWSAAQRAERGLELTFGTSVSGIRQKKRIHNIYKENYSPSL